MMAARALAVDDRSSEAHTSMAALLTDDRDWARAEAEFKRAIELRPGNPLAHHWYSALLVILNRPEEALHEISTASDLDPLSQAARGFKVMVQFFAGVRTPKGRPANGKALVDPTQPGTRASNAVGLAQAKRCPEAYDESRAAQALAPDNTLILLSHAAVDYLCGKAKSADSLLHRIERRPDAPIMGVYIAAFYTAQGKTDSAFAWLDRTHWGMQPLFELRMNRDLQPLRSDPRYRQLLTRLNMP
jgi:serine/threonine-protein kinase